MASPLTVIYEFDRFRLDRGNQRLTRDGMLLVTPGKTLAILLDLIEHRDQVVPIPKLIDAHFPKSSFGEEELSSEVLKLKRIMDDTSHAPLVRFVLGQGFQFDGEVTEYLGDSTSDQNFGSKAEEYRSVPIAKPTKPKGPILGTITAVVAMALLGIGVWRYMPTHESTSDNAFSTPSESSEFTGTPQVAVLPFQSLTGQANDEGFNKSLTEGIYKALGNKSEVKVVPPTAVQHYLESGVSDPVTAGQKLGVQMIVHGMAQRLAGHVMVKVQLVSTQDGSQIWSTGFEGTSDDIAGLSAKIADKVSKGAEP